MHSTHISSFFYPERPAQTTVSGTVTDETGETLIGVSVKIKGTSLGVMTDAQWKIHPQSS